MRMQKEFLELGMKSNDIEDMMISENIDESEPLIVQYPSMITKPQ